MTPHPDTRPACAGFVAALTLALLTLPAQAQMFGANPDWREVAAPAPIAPDLKNLVMFPVPGGTTLKYGVEPRSISLGSDGVLRYVVVAQSDSGALNVMHEGVRCATGEVKTYARYSAAGQWSPVNDPQWQPLVGRLPSRHSLALAREGLCDGASPAGNADAVLRRLRSGFPVIRP